MSTQIPLNPNAAEGGDDPYHTAIDKAGFKVTPALLDEVKRLHRAALNEALVLRAFSTVRAAQRRRTAS